MSMFGLKEMEVAELVRAISVPGLDREAIEERFARATWTGLAEPGDRVAGALVAALGAPRALAAVVEKRAPADLVGEVGADLGAADLGAADLEQGIARWQPRVSSSNALLALRQAARFGAALRIPGDEAWPTGFDVFDTQGPLALWTRGTESALLALSRSIALVGARAATGYGEHVTMEASAGLVDRGYAIVSGAAYGIDGMAHRAALASHGETIAFLAGGVDRFYPSGHDALLTRIVEFGCVVSELPCGSPPTRWRFLQRNRLIAAASLATVVLEAGWRSGSLNTAGHAAGFGRPLGAVPGPVTSAASAGCHRLLREFTALCVTNADEMAELAPLASGGPPIAEAGSPPAGPGRDSPSQVRVMDALSARSARAATDIAARSGMSVAEVQSVLGGLELEGVVREGERGWLKPAPKKPSATQR